MSEIAPTRTGKPKWSTVLQQTKQLQHVVSRFANELGTQGLALTNLTVKAKVGRSLSALVSAWGLLEESRLRLTKNANPLFPRGARGAAEEEDEPDEAAAPPSLETFEEPSTPIAVENFPKESLSRPDGPTPDPGRGPKESGSS